MTRTFKGYKYSGQAEKYRELDFSAPIHCRLGTVKVGSIFAPLPDFMKTATVIYCDPPCSNVNINTFYTKAEKEKEGDIAAFSRRLIEAIDEIGPREVFLETFKSNVDDMEKALRAIFPFVRRYNTTYYKTHANFILHAAKQESDLPIEGMDEEAIVKYIATSRKDDIIGDPCFGRGIIGMYCTLAGTRFVGQELNKNRLCEFLTFDREGINPFTGKRKDAL